MTRHLLILFATLACLLPFTRPVWAQLREVEALTSWAFEADAVHPSGVFHAALKVSLEGNFHVQSNEPAEDALPERAMALFESLDAPVRVIGALDTPVPYSPPLEEFFLVSEEQILNAARLLSRY